MQRLAKISFILVLFGQLSFSAAVYYLSVAAPSWPFWLALYTVAIFFVLQHVKQLKLALPDLYILIFAGYLVTSFFILGESAASEFSRLMLLTILGPYFIGRILGQYIQIDLFSGLRVISLLYLLLVVIELAINPSLFQIDRLYLFRGDDWDQTGGDPTSFNIGITVGAAWVAALSYLTYDGVKHSRTVILCTRLRLWAIILTYPIILLLIGSRTSMVSAVLCGATYVILARHISTRMKIKWFVVGIVGVLFFYLQLSEQKKIYIDEIQFTLNGLYDFSANTTGCINGSSIFIRLMQLREALLLFVEFPIFGIGATNFGYRFCGLAIEFASPHSFFAHVLVENGFFGASLLILALIKIIRIYLLRMQSSAFLGHLDVRIIFGVWMFVLIHVQFTGNLFYDYHIFMLTGFLVSYLHHRN